MPHEHHLKQNRLLAALSPGELKILRPHLELAQLRSGEILAESNKTPSQVYFPIDCAISLYYRMENGGVAEIAMIGNEGMFSVAQIMGGDAMPYFATVETTGHAFRIDRNVLKEEFSRNDLLRHTLMLYSQAALTQMAQAGVCSRKHTLYQQLCLHLLLVHDKSLSDDFILTQESLSHMLGVRREGVTVAAGKLRDEGLIDYKWGHITVIDRARLETQCCECYEVVRKEFKRLLGYS
jgi:CRP-like cAMP-binding protein